MTKDAVIIFDDEFLVVDANPALCAILKKTPSQVIGRPMADFFPPELLSSADKTFTDFKKTGTWEGQWPVRAVDGTVVAMTWRAQVTFQPGFHFTIGHQVLRPNDKTSQLTCLLSDCLRSASGPFFSRERVMNDLTVEACPHHGPLNAPCLLNRSVPIC